ncbi:MAG: ABC transporter permease, partial [Candidatus Hydrogenedentes bacterium]|nr:ABC transporter permease [Candidatus Hydrogenedentota bacterium]
FMDTPTGNIALSDYEELRKHEDVAAAFPICMGDTYRGFRIVGTIRELFDYTWTNASTGETRQPFRLAEGRPFEKAMEAVLGSAVARAEGLKVGDTFVGSHGFIELPEGLGDDHSKFPYTVVGILEPSGTPNDRALFCTMDSVWDVHAHNEKEAPGELHKEATSEVTAILISLQSPSLRFQFVEYVNDTFNAMATIPIQQVANLYANILGTAKSVLLAVGYLVVAISAISVLIGLYLSIFQRKRDLAVMRALGASAYEIVSSVLIEAFLVTVLGIAAGWLLGNGVCWVLGQYLERRYGLSVGIFGLLTFDEVAAFATIALVGLVAGILPAWQAYRTDVARDLAEL